MDRLDEYKQAIHKLMADVAESRVHEDGVEVELIIDDEHFVYQVKELGWRDTDRVQDDIVLLRIKDNKLWIEEDWTEEGIATQLIEKGFTKEQIVLAFNPPFVRELTEFAVA